jgi:hypothetical protein
MACRRDRRPVSRLCLGKYASGDWSIRPWRMGIRFSSRPSFEALISATMSRFSPCPRITLPCDERGHFPRSDLPASRRCSLVRIAISSHVGVESLTVLSFDWHNRHVRRLRSVEYRLYDYVASVPPFFPPPVWVVASFRVRRAAVPSAPWAAVVWTKVLLCEAACSDSVRVVRSLAALPVRRKHHR